jgi:tetratricopeptide (TPR) repeat protein
VGFRLASFGFGVIVLTAVGFFVLFPQLKPDWLQVHVGKGGPGNRASAGGMFRTVSLAPQRSPGDESFERGLSHAEHERWDEAIKEFDELVKLEPDNSAAYHLRGISWHNKTELEKAVADYDAALRLAPKNDEVLVDRARALYAQNRNELALADIEAAIGLATKDPSAYWVRGAIREEAGDFKTALADYEQAVKLSPDDVSSLNCLAWLLATAPEPALRNGRRAHALALRAVEIDEAQDWDTLDTLAAAFAETGDYTRAIMCETESIRLAAPEDHDELKARLNLYKARKPYRQSQSPQ